MKKEVTKNKLFLSVRDKLEFVHKNCKEPELFEDLKQLFRKKGFKNVSIEHGSTEFGKDLVFSICDPAFGEDKWYAVIVKNKNASQNDFVQGGEILTQIELASKIPYADSKSQRHDISGVFVVINGSVSFQAKEVMQKFIEPILLSNIKIWDYQELASEIENNIKDIFLDRIEPIIHVFSKTQLNKLSDLTTTNQLFNLNIHDIDEIFVNVQTTYSRHIKKLNDYVSFENGKPKKEPIEEIDGVKEILLSDKNFIIHGIPTSGKSLLLKRLGIKALQPKNGKPNAVFFFDLPKVVNTLPKNKKLELVDLMTAQYSDYTAGEILDFKEFEKIYLLLDSLDEIKSTELKKMVLNKIEEFVKKKHEFQIQIILSTRTIEIIDKENILTDFEKTELLPFNVGQALSLFKKIIPDNKIKSHAFINALKNSLLKSGLLRTPLALTLVAILYRDDKIDLRELPANITELYNKFVDTYLDRWDVSKGIARQYLYEQTKNILAFIALKMHLEGLNQVAESQLLDFLSEIKEDYSFEELDNIPNFLNHLKWENGVFNYDDLNGSFSFYNHYFQEYFVSLCIDDSTESTLNDNFFSDWWENSIVFYCGKQPKRDVFLKNACDTIIPITLKDQFTYIQLVSKCIQASHSISKRSRQKIVAKLLFEFDRFFLAFIKEGKDGKTFAGTATTMDVIISFRDLFDKLFYSKHITTEETCEYFENVLIDQRNNFDEVTRYCIAYFLALHYKKPVALEIFLDDENLSTIWDRIVYVDINFMKYKKTIGEKMFSRIKRKMLKNKFLIIEQMNTRSIDILGSEETA